MSKYMPHFIYGYSCQTRYTWHRDELGEILMTFEFVPPFVAYFFMENVFGTRVFALWIFKD